MNVVKNTNTIYGEIDIAEIKVDPKSRNEIDRTIRVLQFSYINPELRKQVFELLETELLPKLSKENGNPGLDLWEILVMGILRQVCQWDYDRLQNMSNNHYTIRALMGRRSDSRGQNYYYELHKIKNNVKLLTPDLLDKFNQIMLENGQKLFGNKKKVIYI